MPPMASAHPSPPTHSASNSPSHIIPPTLNPMFIILHHLFLTTLPLSLLPSFMLSSYPLLLMHYPTPPDLIHLLQISPLLLPLLLLLLGPLLTLSSISWLSMWIGLEMNLLGIIPLIANSSSPFRKEASSKYFLINAASSSLLIISSLSLNHIMPSHFMLSLLTVSMLIKLAAAPFHMWLPAIANSLSWPILIIILTWQKLAPLIIITVASPLYTLLPSIIMSLLLGSINIINQVFLKSLMVYSSITHIAWILIAIFTSSSLSLFYLILYSMTTLTLIHLFHSMSLSSINHLNKLPLLLLILMFLSILSMSGFPPLIMFIPKMLIFFELKSMSSSWLIPLALISSTVISMYVYLTLINSSLSMYSYNLKYLPSNLSLHCLFLALSPLLAPLLILVYM